MSQTDAALVRRCADGDPNALGELYDRHAVHMQGQARRFLGDDPEADELVHDVFLEAWRRAASYDPQRGSVRGWLVVMTRSRALDRLRRADRRLRGQMPAVVGQVESNPSTVFSMERMARSLDNLSPEQRSVVELSYFSGLNSREISEQLGVPIGTIKSRLRTALAKLRAGVGGGAP